MSKAYQLTPEQIALSQERKLKKQLGAQKTTEPTKHDPRGDVLPREWLRVQRADGDVESSSSVRVKEVDRTEKLFPILEKAGYTCVYTSGPRKKHGCTIAFRKESFVEVDRRTIFYDDEEVRDSTVENLLARKAGTRVTKNIANIVALRHQKNPEDGVIVATTHLFWHPRQAGILFREVDKFRQKLGKPEWPCIVAGDFNFQPNDAAYSLLVGDTLLPDQLENLKISRVVHTTLDPTIQLATPAAAAAEDQEEDESGGGQSDPDKIITNARKARSEDGLLSDEELADLFRRSWRVVSAYDTGLRAMQADSERKVHELTFGSRVATAPDRHGANEPVWTSYTHYWKTVLGNSAFATAYRPPWNSRPTFADYIFVLDTPAAPVSVLSLASPHTADKFGEGLPRKGVCGSDHMSLGAELSWPTSSSTARV
ncbi:hypothetical protein EIP86_011269 [Pleurotus ostreatoroseus]|nr:hypothetical protein EIP86_011269 [Pleurotus ostreatoroseus]